MTTSLPSRSAHGGLASLARALAPAYDGEAPTVLCDRADVVETLRLHDVRAYTFDEVVDAPARDLVNVVFMPVHYAATPNGSFIEEYFGRSRMLVIPVASFCQSSRGALYLLSMLGDVDLERCVEGNLEWLDHMETAHELRLVGPGTDVTVTLGDELYLMSPKTSPLIERGEWVSFAQFLEIGLLGVAPGQQPKHTVNGVFSAEGLVVAAHRYAKEGVLARVPDAFDLVQDIRGRHDGAPFVIELVDSRPVSLTCGGEDIAARIWELTDLDYRPFVTEVAFAVAPLRDLEQVDWTINSQLNEAAGGMHLGLGAGMSGVHIDLVAPRAVLVP